MKKFISITVTVIILVFVSTASFAQEETSTPSRIPQWIPEKGYWVVKSNIKTPAEQTVYYYTDSNVLVYEQTISGRKLNLTKRKVKMQLKKDLETYVAAWESKQKDNLASNQ